MLLNYRTSFVALSRAVQNSHFSFYVVQEQDNFKNSDALRRQLEVELRDVTARLEEAESFAQKEGKRLVAKLQAKVQC